MVQPVEPLADAIILCPQKGAHILPAHLVATRRDRDQHGGEMMLVAIPIEPQIAPEEIQADRAGGGEGEDQEHAPPLRQAVGRCVKPGATGASASVTATSSTRAAGGPWRQR